MAAWEQVKANKGAAGIDGTPAVKVRRALLVGIVVRDWIRAEVMELNADRISVRIDDLGRRSHAIGERPLVKGMTIWPAATEWTPLGLAGDQSRNSRASSLTGRLSMQALGVNYPSGRIPTVPCLEA